MASFDSRLRGWLTPTQYVWFARAPFLFASLGGGGILIAMKAYEVPQLWVTIAAVAIIGGYLVAVTAIPQLRLRDDVAGDNCYYLGFLFTLASLSFALYEFAERPEVSVIISNFGLALGSTMAGVLLRVTINQVRKDVLETEEDARMELAQAVMRLRAKIDDTVLALDGFFHIARQTIEEQINASANHAASALDEAVEKVGSSTDRVLGRIDEAFEQFSNHSAQLNEASAQTVKGLGSLVKKIDKIEAPSDLVSRRFEPAMEKAAQAIERMDGLLRNEEEIRSKTADKSLATVERIEQVIEKIAVATNMLADTATRMEGATKATESAAQNTAKALEQTGDMIDGQLRGAAEAKESIRNLVEELLAEQRALVGALDKSLSEVTGTLKAHNEEFATELERSRRMVAQTGAALSELADSVVERLG